MKIISSILLCSSRKRKGFYLIDFQLYTPDNVKFGNNGTLSVNFTGVLQKLDPERTYKYYP